MTDVNFIIVNKREITAVPLIHQQDENEICRRSWSKLMQSCSNWDHYRMIHVHRLPPRLVTENINAATEGCKTKLFSATVCWLEPFLLENLWATLVWQNGFFQTLPTIWVGWRWSKMTPALADSCWFLEKPLKQSAVHLSSI